MEQLLIPSRFRGPTISGNGGWSAGALAALLARDTDGPPFTAVEVTLRKPPPLDRALDATTDGDTAQMSDGDALVATARLVPDAEPTPVAAVSHDEAVAARNAYPGLTDHPFPQCFTCGPDRGDDDGLRLFSGSVGVGDTRVATDWTPVASLAGADPNRVSVPVTWAALDCPGAWSVDLSGRAVVLGRMTASIDALPVIGEPHVVMGDLRGNDGRKWFTASTIHDADGRIVARAEHTWIEVDPATFNS